MGRASSHTKKDAQVIERLDDADYGLHAIKNDLDNTDYGLQAIKNEIVDPTHGLNTIEGILEDSSYGLEQARIDRGRIKHDIINRPRPYPYDPQVSFNPAAGVGADNFGNYLSLIPRATFDFGDSPNRLQVLSVNFEVFSGNGTFVLEFYSSTDDVTYFPLGAIRTIRSQALVRSIFVDRPCRDYNCDTGTLYARLKSAVGSNNVTISLSVERHIPTSYEVPPSTGVWPTG